MITFCSRFCLNLVAIFALSMTLTYSTQAQTQAVNWTGYSQMPNTGTTPSSPTSVIYQGQLYLFTRGFDNQIHYNVLGTTWGPYLTVPGGANTSSAPEPVVYNGLLFVFTRGYSDSKIWFNSFNGTSWSSYQQVPGNATAAAEPIPVVQNGELVLFNLGAGDSKFYFNQSINPYASSNPWVGYAGVPPASATSASQLGAAAFAQNNINEILLFFRGSGNSIYYNTYLFDGYYNNGILTLDYYWNNYYTQVPGNVTTDSGPIPVSYNEGSTQPTFNNLLLFYKGFGNGQVNYTMLNQATNSWYGPFQIPYGTAANTVSTSIAPNAVVYNNYIFVFQRGSNNKIYYTQGYY